MSAAVRRALFGTDGIRAPFGSYPLDAPTVIALGDALGRTLAERSQPPRVLLGGDTRESTPELCRWLATGLTAAGAEVVYAGTLPTAGVALLTRRQRADCGIAVSASHNPMPDNGIKLFGADGFKWTPEQELALERRLPASDGGELPLPEILEPEVAPGLGPAYLEALAAGFPDDLLAGLPVVLDSANGAASAYAEPLFARLGAAVDSLCDAPDGRNINRDCGSTHPRRMAETTASSGAALGVAFDGDADRALFADETGRVWDGDAILYLWARDLLARGELDPPRIVATSMSNLGLEVALRAAGIGVLRCDVGDRVVVETLRREGLRLGGEQSGHIVDLELATTGDGLLTSLQVASILVRRGEPMSELLAELPRYPQVLQNVRVAAKPDLLSLPRVAATAGAVEARLGDRGRLVLRYSGTEPLARVMIEGPDQQQIENLAAELCDAIASEIGAEASTAGPTDAGPERPLHSGEGA